MPCFAIANPHERCTGRATAAASSAMQVCLVVTENSSSYAGWMSQKGIYMGKADKDALRARV